jgi:(1->4)-alpha-D-glucan 1-alpha-D-glucosylmutase
VNKRIPGATYRLQFNRDFTFAQAREVVGYLHDLGITDCYASPLFKAAPQSNHGYDVCNFNRLNPNLGTSEDFERFVARLRELDMGLLLDMVPNHMSTDLSNRWWFDVLENGSASKYANWFDIDWQRFEGGKVLLPVLENALESVLVAGKLRVLSEAGKFFIAYYDRRFPVSPTSSACISKQIAGEKARASLKDLNGIPGQPASFARLRDLLEHQHYRLVHWRTGSQQINYRRFFDVSELISLRMELPEVFEATHNLVGSLVKGQKITGLRIDHPDGLWDPKEYLNRLQEKVGAIYVVVEKILIDDEPLPEDWPADGTTGYDFLHRVNGIFVNQENKAVFDCLYSAFIGSHCDFREMVYSAKKRILEKSFPSELNALSLRLEEIANSIQPGSSYDQGELREILVEVLACFPVYRTYVTEDTDELSAVEEEQIGQAIHDVRAKLSTHARRSVAAPAGAPHPLEEAGLGPLCLIHDLLHLRTPKHLDDSAKHQCRQFVMRFQQLSGPLTAKGLEDTTFYNFNRLISLNEVGGNPGSFGNSIDSFHQHNLQKAARWPHSLLATATHDTKRGEDVRARINVLSEIPDEWEAALRRWQKLNADKKTVVNGEAAPHPNDEYLFYQTLIGAWPEHPTADQWVLFRQRIVACMLKSIKEAKARTSWTHPNAAYEDATSKFIEETLPDSAANAFVADFDAFQRKAGFFGRLNSLSQTLLKMTAPGVPDFYQGTELWGFSLVDPDNRRPVDYEVRRQILAEFKAQAAQDPTSRRQFLEEFSHGDQLGRSKLYLIWRILEFRSRHRALFESGSYVPLTAVGAKKQHLCTFARVWQDDVVIVVAPRLVVSLVKSQTRRPLGAEVWADTNIRLPDDVAKRQFTNILTGEVLNLPDGGGDKGLSVGQILSHFPVALLV